MRSNSSGVVCLFSWTRFCGVEGIYSLKRVHESQEWNLDISEQSDGELEARGPIEEMVGAVSLGNSLANERLEVQFERWCQTLRDECQQWPESRPNCRRDSTPLLIEKQ
jgi:hypothetical protein